MTLLQEKVKNDFEKIFEVVAENKADCDKKIENIVKKDIPQLRN